jgi:hypothetical protein
VSSAAEIPQRDEALKSLVTRFKEAPGSSAFVELAAALLARGHASESLRIAEHGLQLVPDNADGRVERAAALLALGRPRVAYVELLRALAIHPNHKRGMRLLGRAFVDAGAPGRAAALLAKRSGRAAKGGSAPAPAAFHERPQIDDLPPTPPPPPAPRAGDDVPALFSALTKDLGLGMAAPLQRVPPRRVEVTQIIRRKALPRPPRSASELAEIEGPIVDTTQPGQIHDLTLEDEPANAVTTREPAPLWGEQTPGLADFALDDEPLFQEHMPFEVRPVAAGDAHAHPGQDLPDDLPDLSAELEEVGDTVVDAIEAADDPLEPITAPATPSPMRLAEGPPSLGGGGRAATSDLELPTAPRRAGLPPGLEPPGRAAPTAPMAPRPEPGPGRATRSPPPMEREPLNPRAPTALIPVADTTPSARALPDEHPGPAAQRALDPVGVLVEKSRRRDQALEVVTPGVPPARVALAAATALAMLLYVAGLAWLGSEGLAVWLGDPAKERGAVAPAVDSDGAQAQRP